MRQLLLSLLAIFVWIASSTVALTDDWFKRFQLWNECQEIFLEVNIDVSDALGLAESQVTKAARSRLRGARMYIDPSDAQHLYPELRVTIFDVDEVYDRKAAAISVIADFRKILEDHLSNEVYYATTWSTRVVISNADSPHIVSVVSRIMDEFIDEYLEVNDKTACDAPTHSLLCENTDVRPCLGPVIKCADGTPPPCVDRPKVSR